MFVLFCFVFCCVRRRGVITRVIPPGEVISYSPNKTDKSRKLSTPKSKKNSHSEEKIKSPKERTNSSSSSDSQPLSLQAKKCKSDSVFLSSPTAKIPKKGSEDTPSKSKSRKHGAESSSEKTPNKSRKHSSSGKGTPSKSIKDDKSTKKVPSTPTTKKSSNEKLASPKNKSPTQLGSPKASKSPSCSKRMGSESEIIVIDDDGDDDKGSSLKGPSPKLSSPKEKPVYNWPVAALYQYEIRLHSDRGSKKKEKRPEIVVVQASVVR